MRRLHAGSKDLGLDTVFIFSISYSIRVYAFILKIPVLSMTFRGTFLVAKDTSNHSDHLHCMSYANDLSCFITSNSPCRIPTLN